GIDHAPLVAECAAVALRRALTIIEGHGGALARVDHYPGGHKLLALFGAPVAHEQDALHAVQAALAMRGALREVNEEIAKRIEKAELRIQKKTALQEQRNSQFSILNSQ